VRDLGLKQASDEVIWEWAGRKSFTIVTTDADFVDLRYA
jgi:predicted nuclease of predicted toxin-antitoxin system